jgi:hypothetical protein
MLKHISDCMYRRQPLALMQRVMGHQDYSLLPLQWDISIYIRKSVTQLRCGSVLGARVVQ